MRRVIVRTPETDRKLVEIPTKLTELDDYAGSIAHGTGEVTTTNIVEPFTSENSSFDTTNEVVNMGTGPELTAQVAGLYLCIVTVRWALDAVNPQDRYIGISKNGASSFEEYLYINDNNAAGVAKNTDDQASFLIRLAVGDTVQPRVQNPTAGAYEHTATLQVVRVAP